MFKTGGLKYVSEDNLYHKNENHKQTTFN